MSKKKINRFAYKIAVFIQIALIIAVFTVDYLTDKKAGVMQYVYYNRFMFENGLLNVDNLQILKVVSLILFVIFAIVLIYCIKKNKNKFTKTQVTITTIMSIAVYFVISSNYFMDKLAYHYFIIAILMVLIIQIGVLLTTLYSNKHYK